MGHVYRMNGTAPPPDTNNVLIELMQEALQTQASRSLQYRMDHKRIDKFINENYFAYDALASRMQQLKQEYFQFDGKKFVNEEFEKDGQKHERHILLEGKTEEDRMKFRERMSELMNEKIRIAFPI